MHHVLLVRSEKRIGDLGAVAKHLLDRQGTAAQPVGETLAFEKLHHQVVEAILMTDIEERADMGMGQRGDGARFAIEALARGRRHFRQDLDRYGSIEARVARAIDLAHPARPD